ncbi:MAG: ABC transporter ATP-binding protein, partial [Candidatus Methylomirabilales bacterium]
MSVIHLDHVTKRYRPEDLPAVDQLTLEVEHGEILALLGPSGCGKTTTLRLIAGFERADTGKIEIAGTLVADGPWGLAPELRGAGMVFQDYALFPHLTVEGNIGFGLASMEPKAKAERVQEVLALVGLERLATRFPHELSGGQQQRVALGRALAPRPAVLLLDEPLSNLDADMRAQVRQDLHVILRQTGSTTLFVTHDQEEAFMIGDRVGVLNGGHLEQLDRPEEIYHLPATRFVARFVGKADFLPGTVTEEGIVTEIGILPNRPGFPVGTR